MWLLKVSIHLYFEIEGLIEACPPPGLPQMDIADIDHYRAVHTQAVGNHLPPEWTLDAFIAH